MTATTLEPGYRAQIEGDVYGQVAVGANVIQIGHISGGKVEIYQGGSPRRRPTPQERPRPFPNLLGREQEVTLITNALNAAEVVEIAGRAGVGKTSLVRHIAHIVPPPADGVVHRATGPRPLEDVLQLLYDAFYTSDIPVKRRFGELVSDLNGIRALIYLDDLTLSREDVERLLDALQAATIMFVSTERRLWGGTGRSLGLRGLPPAGALALLEQELGRRPAGEEHAAAQVLVQALEGVPLDILRVAARAREEALSLVQLAQEMQTAQPSQPSQKLAGSVVSALSGREKQIVAALATLGDVPLHEEHLEAIAAPLATVLEKLMAKGAIQAHSPEYSLTGNLGDVLPAEWLPPWRDWLLNHFIQWATDHRSEPELLLRDAPAIVQTLEWAVNNNRWTEALALIQIVEPALALDRQWAASRRLLTWALQGAEVTGNQAARAWALHQQGTYYLGLGERNLARETLQQALDIRERLGDRVGAALTRHNLSFLIGPPPPPSRPEPTPDKPPSLMRPLLIGAGLLGAIGILLVGVLVVIANRDRKNIRPVVTPAGEQVVPIEPQDEALPDLVVASWATLAEPFRNEENLSNRLASFEVFLVPVELVIQNEGNAEAGPFFVSVHSVRGPCEEVLPFVVSGRQTSAIPEFGGVPPNDSIAIEGLVALSGAGPGVSCALVARVDSIVPDPNLPETGRVRESNEGNNQSELFVVNIGEEASNTPPVVEILAPKEGSTFGYTDFDDNANRWFAVVFLEAVAFDEEDGELPPAAMRWETSRADLQDSFLVQGNGLEVRLYGTEDLCAAQFHDITVIAMDSNGDLAQATTFVTLQTIC